MKNVALEERYFRFLTMKREMNKLDVTGRNWRKFKEEKKEK